MLLTDLTDEAVGRLLAVGVAPDPVVAAHAQRLVAAMADWDTGGTRPNFGPPHDSASARRACVEVTLARLAAVAERCDPDGVLAAGASARLTEAAPGT